MEWEIFTVVIAIVGAVITVTTPVLKLTNTITKLNETCENLESRFKEFEDNNKNSHRRIWEHNEEQDSTLINHDKVLSNHETRITILEEEKNRYEERH